MFIERGEKREEKREEEVKKAFDKVKSDIFSLGNEISQLKLDILDTKNQLNQLIEIQNQRLLAQITSANNPTHTPKIPTVGITPTDNPTVPMEAGGLKYLNFDTSIGNGGVPTDKPTNQQTDNPTHFSLHEDEKYEQITTKMPLKSLSQHIYDASEILDSLDSLKKEIRLKFKGMTTQEMLVFSTIYQLEQQYPEGLEYSQIAQKLKLSSSSIRDYTQRLISKGIPILKEKVNNKKILLKISPELKKIATLDTIIKLRDL